MDKVVISVSIANFGKLSIDELIEFIKLRVPDSEAYKHEFPKGTIYAAAVEWKLVGRVSSVLGILGFFWTAYSELIKPHKDEHSNSGIVISIDNLEIHNNIWIGAQVKTEKELLDSIKIILDQNKVSVEKTEKLLDSLTNSKNWKVVK